MSFINFNLQPSLLKALQGQGYTAPTPIQEQAIPVVLGKRDLLGCAQTGTGKTAAFVIPLLQQLLEQTAVPPTQRLRTLIIAPTRELAIQIGETVQAISKHTNLQYAVIFGGVPQYSQVKQIQRGVDILVATPGRLKDLLNQGLVSLRSIQHFVLDEADRMLDMGFIHDVKHIIQRLPEKKQTLLFSATMPANILQLATSLLQNPVRVTITPVSTTAERVTQQVYFAEKNDKPTLLLHLLETTATDTVIIFTQMKYMADKISRFLNKSGIAAEAIHGNKSQRQREAALEKFKRRQSRILVATDIAARGIDVEKLAHVINYDLPQAAETYVHRIGRTGRAGEVGIAISICSREERPLLNDIQKLLKATIPVMTASIKIRTAPPEVKPVVEVYKPLREGHQKHQSPHRKGTGGFKRRTNNVHTFSNGNKQR